MAAPFPAPQYITIANVQELFSRDKVNIGLGVNDISPAEADVLVAQGEAVVLWDLSPYYITSPALITLEDQPWTALPAYVYSQIYNMFVYQAALALIGNYIARNTDDQNGTLSYFQQFYNSEYAKWLNRIIEILPNGGYRYQLIGLRTLDPGGIPPRLTSYGLNGLIGGADYSQGQLTNPQLNWTGQFTGRRFRS